MYWVLAGLGVLGGAATWLFLLPHDGGGDARCDPGPLRPEPEHRLAFGGLLVGHVVGLVVLVLAAQWARRDPRSAARFAAVAFLADSLLGLVLSLLTTGGALVAPWPQRPYQP